LAMELNTNCCSVELNLHLQNQLHAFIIISICLESYTWLGNATTIQSGALGAAFFGSLQLSLCRRPITLFWAVNYSVVTFWSSATENMWFERHLTTLCLVPYHVPFEKQTVAASSPTRALFHAFFLIGFYRGFTREDTGYCNSRKWFEEVHTCLNVYVHQLMHL
jgi:hypothetical protein